MRTQRRNLSPSYRRGRPPKLIEEIIAKIDSDYLTVQEPGTLLPTQQDLTQRYGVSRATIRSAFDILEFRKAVVRNSTVGTYVAHPPSQDDAPLKQKEIAVSFARSFRMMESGPFANYILTGLLNELARNDMHLTLLSSDWRWEKDNPPKRHLAPDHFVGCVLLGRHKPDDIESLKSTGKLLVAIDFNACDAGLPSFIFDNMGAGAQLARRLWRLGHRRVATLFEDPDRPQDKQDEAWRDRRLGFLTQWAKFNGPAPLETFTPNRWEFKMAYGKLRQALKTPRKERPTALVLPGWGQLNVLREISEGLGLAVPKDLSLVAMGMKDEYPDLTGVRFNSSRLGERAGAYLINTLLNPGLTPQRSKPTALKGRYVAAQTHGKAPV